MKNGNIDLSLNLIDKELANINSYTLKETDLGRRVLCLYRVSTDKQVTYDSNNEADIPMQRRECRRFLERQGWVLVHEEREDGISGHKVRAEKRDSIQIIKELALARKFDILLVFMFDRIGRIADETPFVVEWLVRNNVRVWSAKEGEQRFDNHADKLMNYIRFWQADGESEKISMRTRAGLALLVEDGFYKGGTPPYGYELVKSGRFDKKKNEKKNLAIHKEEAVVVRKIFDYYVKRGFGINKIAYTLTGEGVRTRAGKRFNPASIRNILRNLTYTGILRCGETRSNVIEALQIISPDVYEKVMTIMGDRATKLADFQARAYPLHIDSRCLLNGKVYCAHCGSRLVITTNGRYYVIDGELRKRIRYTCYAKTRKLVDCKGQTGYSSNILDDVVDKIVRQIFAGMKNIPKGEVVTSGLAAFQEDKEARYKTAQREFVKKEAELIELKSEVLKAIRGESKFSPDILNELIIQTEVALKEFETTRNMAKRELDMCKYRIEDMQKQYDEVISWSELYDAADLPSKKMVVANLINRVDVGTDYRVHIDFNIDLDHYNIKHPCNDSKSETA